MDNQTYSAEIHEAEARSLVNDIVCSTDYGNPDALLKLLIRLDGLGRVELQNSVDALIGAAFRRSRVCEAVCEAYRVGVVAQQEVAI